MVDGQPAQKKSQRARCQPACEVLTLFPVLLQCELRVVRLLTAVSKRLERKQDRVSVSGAFQTRRDVREQGGWGYTSHEKNKTWPKTPGTKKETKREKNNKTTKTTEQQNNGTSNYRYQASAAKKTADKRPFTSGHALQTLKKRKRHSANSTQV